MKDLSITSTGTNADQLEIEPDETALVFAIIRALRVRLETYSRRITKIEFKFRRIGEHYEEWLFWEVWYQPDSSDDTFVVSFGGRIKLNERRTTRGRQLERPSLIADLIKRELAEALANRAKRDARKSATASADAEAIHGLRRHKH